MREPLRLALTTAPARLPVGLDEIKAQLRLEDDQTAEDAVAMGVVRTAVEACEDFTARALITQTWTLFRDRWPGARGDAWPREGLSQGVERRGAGRALSLPRPPLQAIVHVKTFDENDVEAVWPTANYFADTASEPGRLVARTGRTLPTPGRAANGIEVRFVAGYGGDAADVPEPLRQGVLRLAAYLFENRGDRAVETAVHGSGAAALWQPFKVQRL
ncbi:MAG: hypothetical protein ACE5GS_06715 [Kiloniellaceae bacterium]